MYSFEFNKDPNGDFTDRTVSDPGSALTATTVLDPYGPYCENKVITYIQNKIANRIDGGESCNNPIVKQAAEKLARMSDPKIHNFLIRFRSFLDDKCTTDSRINFLENCVREWKANDNL